MSVRQGERRALAFGLGAVALWSTVATAFKLGLQQLAPLQLLWLASVISLALFATCAIFTGRMREIIGSPARALGAYALLGMLNPFLYYLVLFEAYRRLPAQVAQPLNYTWAITLALLAVPVLRQRLGWRDAIGILTSYAGVLVVLSRGEPLGFRELDPVGVLLALGSTVIWAGYWLASVRSAAHPFVSMTVGFAAGAGAITLACLLTTGLPAPRAGNLAFGAWVGLVEMGIAFLLWREALHRTRRAARMGQLIFLAPFGSLVLISVFVGETIHWATVVGLTGIVGGLIISRR